VAVDAEPGLAAHEFGEVEGDESGVVGDEAGTVDRAEFDA
jgi:hypothetical protein